MYKHAVYQMKLLWNPLEQPTQLEPLLYHSCVFSDGFEETVIGDPETDQALAEFDFLADESKSDISDSDSQNKEQGKKNNALIYLSKLLRVELSGTIKNGVVG